MCPLSASKRIKGVLKHVPCDFVVEEIDGGQNVVLIDSEYSYQDGFGDFLHLVMKKRNVDTLSAVRRICSRLGLMDGRVTYAGVKDKAAFTSQRISIYKFPVERIVGLKMRDVWLYPVGRGGKVYLGDLWGNRFTVCVRNVDMAKDDLSKYVDERIKLLDGRFPNFFGEQRFGSVRPITYPVGLELIRGDIRSAVRMYVSCVFPSEDEKISDIRKIAFSDMRMALGMFPRNYVYERTILEYLLEHEGDYLGAFMTFPFGLQKMFVNAVQSHVFNEVLKLMMKKGVFEDNLRIPLVGYLYGHRIIDDVADMYVERVLKKEKIDPDMFRMRHLPKLVSRGEHRKAFCQFCDFSVLSLGDDDAYPGKTKIVMRFSLPKGCYATVFLSEFFDF